MSGINDHWHYTGLEIIKVLTLLCSTQDQFIAWASVKQRQGRWQFQHAAPNFQIIPFFSVCGSKVNLAERIVLVELIKAEITNET